MPKKVMLRPSAHDQGVLCVGSVQAQEPYGWTTNEDAERGKRLHNATALILQTGEKGIVKVKSNALILDDDYGQIEECLQKAKELRPSDPDVITLIEHKMDLKWLGLTGGKADLIFISMRYSAAVVIDWKFGAGPVPDPEDNRQMLDYSIGIKKEVLDEYGIELESVEAYIIQPGSWKEDDKFREHTWSGEELDSLVPMVQGEARAVQSPKAPRTAGSQQCKFCKHRDNCGEYKEFNDMREEAKETAHKVEVEQVVGSGVLVKADGELPSTVNLIAQSTVDKATEYMELAKSVKVVDAPTANTAGTLSKQMRKIITLVKEKGLELRSAQTAFNKKIITEEKKATDPLEEGVEALDAQVGAFMAAEKAREDKIRAEQERKRREAEEAAERARQAELKKQQEAQEALRKAAEAQERAANLKTKAARDKAEALAAAEFAKATEASKKADEEEETRLQAERDARIAEAEVVSVIPTKIAGYRGKEEVTWDMDDYSKIPKKWLNMILEPNKKAIDLLIKQGKISEDKCSSWITIERKQVAARSR